MQAPRANSFLEHGRFGMAKRRNTVDDAVSALLELLVGKQRAPIGNRASAIRSAASRYMVEASFAASEGGHPSLPSEVSDRLMRDTEPREGPGLPAAAEELASEFTQACADYVCSVTEAFCWWPRGIADGTLVSAYLGSLRSRRRKEASPDISQEEAVEATIRDLVGRLTPYVADGHGAPEDLVEETAVIVTAIERGSAVYAERNRIRLQ